MRRILIVGALAGVGFLIVRAIAPKLRDRLMARCEAMFEQMPDDFPPKRMMRGIEEVRVEYGADRRATRHATTRQTSPRWRR